MRESIVHALPRYDRFVEGKGGLAIGYPWLTIGAIVALEQSIFTTRDTTIPPARVLEFGSGGSTVFFARHAEHVESVETSESWAPLTRAALESHGLSEKVNLTVCTNPESEAFVAKLPDRSFDLLLVDHAADDSVTGRGIRRAFSRLPLATLGIPKLHPAGWLVVDNYAVHGMEYFDYTGWNVWFFDDMRHSGRGTLIARRAVSRRALRG